MAGSIGSGSGAVAMGVKNSAGRGLGPRDDVRRKKPAEQCVAQPASVYHSLLITFFFRFRRSAAAVLIARASLGFT
jgi:hypothetical protein